MRKSSLLRSATETFWKTAYLVRWARIGSRLKPGNEQKFSPRREPGGRPRLAGLHPADLLRQLPLQERLALLTEDVEDGRRPLPVSRAGSALRTRSRCARGHQPINPTCRQSRFSWPPSVERYYSPDGRARTTGAPRHRHLHDVDQVRQLRHLSDDRG